MLTRRDLLMATGAIAVPTIAAGYSTQPSGFEVADAGPATLRQRADRKGLLVGSSVEMPLLANDARLRQALREDANIIVPEISLKWAHVQPTREGPLDFAAPEKIWDFAAANKMQMRGHALTWWREEPKWAQELIPTLSPGAAGDLLTGYISRVVGHWKGRISQWDVCNEPIDAKDQLMEPLFSKVLGEQYIDLAYKAARAADPKALLVFNHDYIAQEHWWQQKQRAATLRLLERLVKRGVPIDAFGIEGHLMLHEQFSETAWRTFCQQVTDLGLKIMITEFDIDDMSVQGSIAARDAAVAAMATSFLDVTMSFPNCMGLLTWGISDRDSWLRKEPTRQRTDKSPLRPLPRDEDYRRKPMWNVIAKAIDNAPPRPRA